MILSQIFRITGVASDEIEDAGITSTEKEKKRIVGVGLQVTGYAGNDVKSYHERTKIFEIPDTMIDLEATAFNTDLSKPGPRMTYKEVGLDLPVGETFNVSIKCGATNHNLIGYYDYELIGG